MAGVYNRENPRRRGRVTGERRLETPRRPVSEPDENDDLPFTRSSIAAIGARRRWRLFGKDEDPGAGDFPDRVGSTRWTKLASRSMLGLRSPARSRTRAPRQRPRGAPRSASLPSTGASGGGASRTLRSPVVAPLTAHSTLGELAGLEEHSCRRSSDRARHPHLSRRPPAPRRPADHGARPRSPAIRNRALLAAFVPGGERTTARSRVIFQEAPGPRRGRTRSGPRSRMRTGGPPGAIRSRPKADVSVRPARAGESRASLPGPRSPRTRRPAKRRAPASAEPQPRAARPSSRRRARSQKRSRRSFRRTCGRSSGRAPARSRSSPALDRAIQEAARSAGRAAKAGAPPGNRGRRVRRLRPRLLRHEVVRLGTVRRGDAAPHQAALGSCRDLARLGLEGQPDRALLHPGRRQRGRREDHSRLGHPAVQFRGPAGDPEVHPVSPAAEGPLNSSREGVTVTFFYNMRPEDAEEPGKSGGKETPVNEIEPIRRRARDGRDGRRGRLLAEPGAGLPRDRALPDRPGLPGRSRSTRATARSSGSPAIASLSEIPPEIRVDIVDVFRRSEAVAPDRRRGHRPRRGLLLHAARGRGRRLGPAAGGRRESGWPWTGASSSSTSGSESPPKSRNVARRIERSFYVPQRDHLRRKTPHYGKNDQTSPLVLRSHRGRRRLRHGGRRLGERHPPVRGAARGHARRPPPHRRRAASVLRRYGPGSRCPRSCRSPRPTSSRATAAAAMNPTRTPSAAKAIRSSSSSALPTAPRPGTAAAAARRRGAQGSPGRHRLHHLGRRLRRHEQPRDRRRRQDRGAGQQPGEVHGQARSATIRRPTWPCSRST